MTSQESTIRHGARGVVIKDGMVLLMHRINRGHEYYVFPGGGIEQGESPAETVQREILEETSIAVEPLQQLYRVVYEDGATQYFFFCRYVDGQPMLGEANESAAIRNGEDQVYEPRWYPIIELSNMTVFPLEVRDWIVSDAQEGFDHEIRSAQVKMGTSLKSA